MIGAIPNPKRELTVQFSNEQVQLAMSNLSKYLIGSGEGNFNQVEYDKIIGQLELSKTEFLSLGVSILINSTPVSDDQTKIEIEVRRQVGSFDKSYEVSEAKRHLDKVVKGLSKLLSNPSVIDEISNETFQEEKEKAENKSVAGFVIAAGVIILYLVSVMM